MSALLIVFLDCEYTDAIDIDLISIALVAEDGQECWSPVGNTVGVGIEMNNMIVDASWVPYTLEIGGNSIHENLDS